MIGRGRGIGRGVGIGIGMEIGEVRYDKIRSGLVRSEADLALVWFWPEPFSALSIYI